MKFYDECTSDLNTFCCIVVVVELPEKTMKMSGGGLEHTYWAHSFHFHWGLDKMHGTEHKINGNQYALEVCTVIILYITSKFRSPLQIANLLQMAMALLTVTIARKDKMLLEFLYKWQR